MSFFADAGAWFDQAVKDTGEWIDQAIQDTGDVLTGNSKTPDNDPVPDPIDPVTNTYDPMNNPSPNSDGYGSISYEALKERVYRSAEIEERRERERAEILGGASPERVIQIWKQWSIDDELLDLAYGDGIDYTGLQLEMISELTMAYGQEGYT